MPSFDILKKHKAEDTFRVKSVIDKFELSNGEITEHFKGDIQIDDDWQIGLIVGSSGTGKTTILNQLFSDCVISDFDFKSNSVIDDMPKSASNSDIHKMFNSVGFSSPPSWIKPYAVLSNGEKMRVELAYSLLSDNNVIAFDEFTSVVDRQVAKVSSFAVQKAVRKTNKKFIAVGCHFDVEEWLMPDWVFDTNTMTMKYNKRRLLQRPNINARVYETTDKAHYWKMFSKYHYLSHSLNNSCKMFVLEIDGEVCGMQAVLHFPHPKVKNLKRGHRLVIHPDYQGLNLGHFLSSEVGQIFKNDGFRFSSVTTNPALSFVRQKDKRWKLTRNGRTSRGGNSRDEAISRTLSSDRITMTWEYVG